MKRREERENHLQLYFSNGSKLEEYLRAEKLFLRGDLIEPFKILTRKDNVNYETLFTMTKTGHL